MKKQIAKVKTFVHKHEREIEKYSWYALGGVIGLIASDVARNNTYNRFAARHPEYDIVTRDKQGHFYGLNLKDEKE